MTNMKQLLILLTFIIITIGTSCKQNANESEVKSQVSESGEPRLVVQLGHSGGISSAVYSPDGKFIVSGSDDKLAILWDAKTGREIRRFTGHKNFINSVAFSPDGKFVLTGSGGDIPIESEKNSETKDFTARLWNIEDGKEVRQFAGHTEKLNSVAFSPDGKYIITGSDDKTARLWELQTGKEIKKLLHKSEVKSLAYSPRKDFVLTTDCDAIDSIAIENCRAKLWKTNSWELVHEFIGQKKDSEEFLSVSFSPDGRFALVGAITPHFEEDTSLDENFEPLVSQYEISSKAKIRDYKGFAPFQFSNDSKFIITAGAGEGRKGSQIWNALTGEKVSFFSPVKFKTANEKNRYGISFGDQTDVIQVAAFSPLNNDILIGYGLVGCSGSACSSIFGNGGTALLNQFEAKSEKLLNSLGGNLSVIDEFSKKSISNNLIRTDDYLWDVRASARTDISQLTKSDDLKYKLLAISNNGKFVAVDSTKRSAQNEARNPKVESGIHEFSVFEIGSNTLLNKHNYKIDFKTANLVTFSPDNKYLLVNCPVGISDEQNWQDDSKTTNKICFFEVKTGRLVWEHIFDAPELGRAASEHVKLKFSADGHFVFTTYLLRSQQEVIETELLILETNKGNFINRFQTINKRFSAEVYKTFNYYDGDTPANILTNGGKIILKVANDGTTTLREENTDKEICRLTSFQNGDWIVTTPDGRFDTNNLDKVEGMHWIMPSEPLRPLPIEIFMRQYYEPRLLARVLKCNEDKNCEQEFKPLPALNTLNRTQPSVKIADIKPDAEGTVEITVEVANTKSEGQKDTFGNPLESGVNDVRLFRDGQLVGYAPKNVSDEQTTWEWIKSWFVEVPKGSNAVELDKDGKATLKFSKIKLPKTGVDKLEFSAYAFNSDQIKSETSRQVYQFKPQTVKGRAYIISMGVNYTEKPNSNLRFAANDARQNQENLTRRLHEQGQYEEVIGIPLISDFTVNVNGQIISAQNATNDQAKSGQTTVSENTATEAHFKTVLDVLAGRQGDAELLKTIKNSDKLRQANPEDLIIISVSSHGFADKDGVFYLLAADANTISSDELSLWLRDVDGGEISLIIDACRSASAVETADFKPAPMNSRGLGQLSYDKGMRILTATQADNVALETNQTRQGLLSYALLQNGLNDFQADFKPKDSTIVMSEWLNFGVERVPRLYEEAQPGQTKLVRETNDTAETETQQRQEKTQRPSLFDFSRKNRDATIEKRAGSVQSKVVEITQTVTPTPTPISTPKSSPTPFPTNKSEDTGIGRFRVVTRNNSGLNITQNKDFNSPKVSFVREGGEVTVLRYDSETVVIEYESGRKERGKWCWVRDDTGKEGWAWGGYLTNNPNYTRR